MSSQHAHFGMPTVISPSFAASLAVVFQIIASGIRVPSLPHQNEKFKCKYIKGTTRGTKEREIKPYLDNSNNISRIGRNSGKIP